MLGESITQECAREEPDMYGVEYRLNVYVLTGEQLDRLIDVRIQRHIQSRALDNPHVGVMEYGR